MEVLNSEYSEKSERQFLKSCFETLKTTNEPEKTGSMLNGIGAFNEYLGREQLKKIYAYKNAESYEVKRGLVNALWGIKTRQAIEIMASLSCNKFKDIRHRATLAFANQKYKSSKLVKEVLWKRINDSELQIDELALWGLAKLKDQRIKEVIKIKLSDLGPTDYLVESIFHLGDLELLSLIKKGDIIKRTNKRVDYAWVKKMQNELLKIV